MNLIFFFKESKPLRCLTDSEIRLCQPSSAQGGAWVPELTPALEGAGGAALRRPLVACARHGHQPPGASRVWGWGRVGHKPEEDHGKRPLSDLEVSLLRAHKDDAGACGPPSHFC